MKKHSHRIFLCSLLITLMLFISAGCNSTRVEEGVTIEKQSGNPLKFW